MKQPSLSVKIAVTKPGNKKKRIKRIKCYDNYPYSQVTSTGKEPLGLYYKNLPELYER